MFGRKTKEEKAKAAEENEEMAKSVEENEEGRRQEIGSRPQSTSSDESPSSQQPQPMEEPAPASQGSDKADKKVKEGWIKSWMMIEALAVSEDAVKSALEKHVKKMALEKNVMVSRRDFKKIERIEKPLPNIEEAYSGVVELEVLAQNYDNLVTIVMNYAPSAVEILEPKKISIDAGEAQGILNSLSDLIHRFVGMTRGAVMVDTK